MTRRMTRLGTIACIAAVAGVAVTSASAPPANSVPLCPGLTIVTAIGQIDGDYESIKTIEAVGPKEVRLKYSAEYQTADGLSGPPILKRTLLHRTVLTADLESAQTYQQNFLENSDELIPGTTAIGVSSAILRRLKTQGESDLSISNSYSGLTLSADRAKFPNYYSYMQTAKLRRDASTRVPVLVNDRLTDLPVVRAVGDSVGDKVEFLILDDEANPLTLGFRIGIGGIKPLSPDAAKLCASTKGAAPAFVLAGGRCDMPNGGDRNTLRVVKISYRCETPADLKPGGAASPAGQAPSGQLGLPAGAAALEQALASTGKVDVYSIYFSFNSDEIREESEPTLKDIADVLRRHPDWKLSVNGHTDGIGSDPFNLDLSKRRSAAVKDALAKRYEVAPGRLRTAGFGRTQPKDTNDTLEGRAHNRRVELVKVE